MNGNDTKSVGRFQSEEELWARLEELERQEILLGELDRYSAAVAVSGLELRKLQACDSVCTQKILP